MELKVEIPEDSFGTFSKQKINASCSPSTSCHLSKENELIDCTKFDFHDDENWLYKLSTRCRTDLQEWLYSPEVDTKSGTKFTSKNIDTRTFTRPKKRFTRPSIEKYNEELYGSEVKELTDSGIQLNGWTVEELPTKPLHFDLDQPSTSVYFENILANAPMMDSFQNMSPPSLVNSMCSSTFANLMENSFIKNDPVLREIRDTDFTGSILQQEVEPMFHSITESYSSLNSDIPENFLRKVSFNNDESGANVEADTTVVLNATFAKEDAVCGETVIINDEDLSESEVANSDNLKNTTYTHLQMPTNTANKDYDRTLVINNTFQRRRSPRKSSINDEQARGQGLNSTITIEPNKNLAIENPKRLLDRRPMTPSYDLNRLSYLIDRNDHNNSPVLNDSVKRNSFGSTDSGENLDYMSISSASSKSSRMQSVDELSDSLEMTERNLQHVMSTPREKSTVLWNNHEISPIADRNSDPELSSIELPVKQNSIRKQKSVGHINHKMPTPKSFNTMTRLGARGMIRGSQPNLKLSETRTQKTSNLNSMGHALKGSYTSLKPTNPNLPVAPPPLDTTVTVSKNSAVVAQIAPVPRETKTEDAQFVRPQPVRSGLPRPVTGIPRPVSRIPGPRKVRPVSKSAGQQGRY